ncbi:hypothetical protein L1049_024853 [Liquidambar formosana]|uniref:Uncharacterized protein n=1 Tax=Liquidambar formosana TaxID=63359 RepID=A0AAP0WYS7_LIQFO
MEKTNLLVHIKDGDCKAIENASERDELSPMVEGPSNTGANVGAMAPATPIVYSPWMKATRRTHRVLPQRSLREHTKVRETDQGSGSRFAVLSNNGASEDNMHDHNAVVSIIVQKEVTGGAFRYSAKEKGKNSSSSGKNVGNRYNPTPKGLHPTGDVATLRPTQVNTPTGQSSSLISLPITLEPFEFSTSYILLASILLKKGYIFLGAVSLS